MRSIYRAVRAFTENYEDFAFSPEHLAALPTRTLLVWGDRDPLNPLDIPFEMYAAMPNASLWVVPDQGHMPLWEDFGGSPEVQAIFGTVVTKFFGGGERPE